MSVALVTGATGLVGSYIAEHLLAEGWRVRALVRSPDGARRGGTIRDGVELAHGDVLDEASFVRAATGAHAIFHAAANIIVAGGWEAYRATNVGGTRNAVAAAESSGARLLQMSSVAVYGAHARYEAARRGGKTDEETPLTPLSARAHYARSKRESEALVLKAHAQGRIWGTVVRPAVIYGRRDRQFVPRIARILRMGIPMPLIAGGTSTMAIVHAANVAQGAALAATSDRAGGRAFNLANDHEVGVRRFAELACEGLGKRPRFIPVPYWFAQGTLISMSGLFRTLTRGRFTLVNRSSVDFISEDNPFSSERAKRDLGWTPSVRPETGIPDAFRWWLEQQG